MRFDNVLGRLAVLVLIQQLGACGGGGGSETPSPPPPPVLPPIVSAQAFAGTEDADTSASLVLRPAAGDTVTVAVTTAPTRGTLTSFAANGAFTYRPNTNLNGADTFTVEATDSRNNRLSAVITMNVAAVNDAPVATGEIRELPLVPITSLDVLANDTDIDDTALTVVIPAAPVGAGEGNPAVGIATVDANNRIQLSFPVGFRGVTRVRYYVRDAAGLQSAEVYSVVFVGTPQFDVWHQGPVPTSAAQLFVTDLVSTRQVTNFVAPRVANGAIISENQDVALIIENDDHQLRDLWTVSTRAVEAPVRMTPGHDATQTLDQFIISPNGAWVAYVVVSAGVKQLWLVERANPAGRRQIPLRTGHEIHGFQNIKFSSNSGALYYLTRTTGDRNHLNRAPVTDPMNPAAIFPRDGELNWFSEWFLSPGDANVIVRSYDILRVSVADPTLRIPMNGPLPSGHSIGQMLADATATRFVYLTVAVNDYVWTDDQLWTCDAEHPGVSTLIVAANAARTGPMSALKIRPDRNAVLVSSWVALANDYQIDLAEVSLAPADGVMRQLSPPPPVNSRTVSMGEYLDDDTIVYSVIEPSRPWRIFETRRGSFDTPTALVEAGNLSTFLSYSPDKAVIATTHSRNITEDSAHYGILVNRAAPIQMLRVTPAASPFATPFIIGLVERQ
jgi:hypothetical protein